MSATVSVAFGVLLYSLSVLVTETAAGSDFSTGILSTAYGGTVLVGGGLAFAVGRIVDRRGVRLLMGVGALMGGAGMAGLAMARAPWQVLAASWLLIGPAGALTFYEPAFVAVERWYAPAERGRAIGLLTVIGGFAGPIFLPLTAALVEGLGWRSAALVLAAILGGTGLAAAAVALPTEKRRAASDPVPGREAGRLFADRRFLTYTASVLLLYAAFQTVIFHRIALFEDGGFGIALISFWAGVSGWVSFPGRYMGPVLGSRRTGANWNAAVIVALALTVVPMAFSSSLPWMVIHFLAFGVVFGAVLPMRAALMTRWYSGRSFGRIMGVQWTLAAFAGAAGPALAGILRDTTESYRSTVAGIVILLLGAASLVLVADRWAGAVSD